MSRINKNLLLLAKIDNLQFADVQNVNMTDIINESLLLTTGQASAKNLHIESRIIRETCRMQTNRTLAESLVNNLMTNAVKHNTIDGRIVIAFDGKRLSVSNTGVNHPLDEKTLFIRFGQTTGKTKGCGLGLAIVHQICALNKWQVDYCFHQGLHNFSITF
jgi:signal transduction histidine kinase